MRLFRRIRPVAVSDIAAEALTLAGGGCALLLQIAHPAVGRGVVEHSDFAQRLMDRLDGTMLYLTATMFGSAEQQTALRRIVNRAHAPVRSRGTSTAPAYNAYDPDLQLWVAGTLYWTMMDLHRRVFGALTPSQAEDAYGQLSRALSNLQLTHDRWPATVAAFGEYWERTVATLAVDAEVLALSRQILYPRRAAWWLRPWLPLVRLITAGLLPDAVRQQFRLDWDERRQRRFDRTIRMLTVVYPRLPMWLRTLPRNRYLAQLRRMVRPREPRPSVSGRAAAD
ncbi:oxygenase MpaB family protein [Leifsonia sp. fls2-241-R2A-40a]|uniref:oxygenase MpaB family protein n=1 Tax=Leifsonia sp. fls2-241-R2A-40a TaxID=3040290 RepID=UPI00254FEA40|nr:oxygenase MpaB family protein [Leifsonia sp. fls2-241-R2A-40a]